MIFVALIGAVFAIINIIFGVLPNIPNLPQSLQTAITDFLDLLFSNSGIVGFFLPMNVVKIALPVALIIVNFKHIYRLFMWLLKKLPWSIE